MTRGGKQPGAGRPPHSEDGAKGTKCLKFTPEVLAYLATLGNTCSVTVEATIRRSKAFRDWLRDSNEGGDQ